MTHARTPALDARLRKMWADGHSLLAIAEAFAMNKTTLTNYRRSLGLPNRRAVVAHTSEWTDDQKADVHKRWLVGQSAGEISRAHPGRTRSAVIGIIHRSGWLRNGRKPPAKPVRAPTVARSRPNPPKPAAGAKAPGTFSLMSQATSTATQAIRAEKAAEGRAFIAKASKVTVDSPNALPFLEARRGCKWPIGEGLAMLSCCNDISRGLYCSGHASIAFSAFQPAPRDRADRSASHLTKHDRVATPQKAANDQDALWDRAA